MLSDIIKSNVCIHLYKPAAEALVSAFHSVPLKISLSRIFARVIYVALYASINRVSPLILCTHRVLQMFISLIAVSPDITDATISENFSNLFGELLKKSEITVIKHIPYNWHFYSSHN